MSGTKILIIEDDLAINELLKKILLAEGYCPTSSYDGLSGLEEARSNLYELILLDITLPYKSGDELVRLIREQSAIPIIILSAKDLVHTKVELLRNGADDYITKPFDIDEVIARIETVLRRTEQKQLNKKQLVFKELVIDCQSKRVHLAGTEINVTAMEYQLLSLFLTYPDKIFSKRNLYEKLTGEVYISSDNTITVHMSNLRHKLRQPNGASDYFETIYGMGYRLFQN